MTLTKEEIDEYKALFKKEYGIELSDAQAFDKGSRLVRFVKLVLQTTHDSKKRSEASNGI